MVGGGGGTGAPETVWSHIMSVSQDKLKEVRVFLDSKSVMDLCLVNMTKSTA